MSGQAAGGVDKNSTLERKFKIITMGDKKITTPEDIAPDNYSKCGGCRQEILIAVNGYGMQVMADGIFRRSHEQHIESHNSGFPAGSGYASQGNGTAGSNAAASRDVFRDGCGIGTRINEGREGRRITTRNIAGG